MKSHLSQQEGAMDTQLFKELKVIHYLLKNFLVGKASELLAKIDIPSLSPGLQMYALHLSARCKLQDYEKTWSPYELIQADKCLTELVRIAHEHGIKPKNPNYLFTRALVKFTLSKEHEDEDRRVRYRDHALRLAETGIKYYPDHYSFQWLRDQLVGTW